MSPAGGPQWKWPDGLDALSAAPEHHHLLLENETVRVLVTRISAGETTAVHTHRWPNVQYVVSTSDFVRRDGDGHIQFDSRRGDGRPRASAALWSAPLPPHCVENVGDGELHVVMVELKHGGAAERHP